MVGKVGRVGKAGMIARLDRYIRTKQHELDDGNNLKRQIERIEIALLHDIKELKSEREMVHNNASS